MQFLVYDSKAGTQRARPVLRWGDVPEEMIPAQAAPGTDERAVHSPIGIPEFEPGPDGTDPRRWVYDPIGDRVDVSIGAHEADFAGPELARANRLLRATDWTQLPDARLSDKARAAWTLYREALRAVPQQAGWPADITWPQPPGPIEEITQ